MRWMSWMRGLATGLGGLFLVLVGVAVLGLGLRWLQVEFFHDASAAFYQRMADIDSAGLPAGNNFEFNIGIIGRSNVGNDIVDVFLDFLHEFGAVAAHLEAQARLSRHDVKTFSATNRPEYNRRLRSSGNRDFKNTVYNVVECNDGAVFTPALPG